MTKFFIKWNNNKFKIFYFFNDQLNSTILFLLSFIWESKILNSLFSSISLSFRISSLTSLYKRNHLNLSIVGPNSLILISGWISDSASFKLSNNKVEEQYSSTLIKILFNFSFDISPLISIFFLKVNNSFVLLSPLSVSFSVVWIIFCESSIISLFIFLFIIYSQFPSVILSLFSSLLISFF